MVNRAKVSFFASRLDPTRFFIPQGVPENHLWREGSVYLVRRQDFRDEAGGFPVSYKPVRPMDELRVAPCDFLPEAVLVPVRSLGEVPES